MIWTWIVATFLWAIAAIRWRKSYRRAQAEEERYYHAVVDVYWKFHDSPYPRPDEVRNFLGSILNGNSTRWE